MWCEVWVKGTDQSSGQRSRSKLIICLWRLKQSHTLLWESCCLPADCLYAFVSADRGASALLFWLLLLYSKSWSSNGDPLVLLCFFPSQVVLAIQIICISIWILELSGECILLGSVSSQQRFGVTDIKALGASQLLGLEQTVLLLLDRSVLQLHVSALFI